MSPVDHRDNSESLMLIDALLSSFLFWTAHHLSGRKLNSIDTHCEATTPDWRVQLSWLWMNTTMNTILRTIKKEGYSEKLNIRHLLLSDIIVSIDHTTLVSCLNRDIPTSQHIWCLHLLWQVSHNYQWWMCDISQETVPFEIPPKQP